MRNAESSYFVRKDDEAQASSAYAAIERVRTRKRTRRQRGTETTTNHGDERKEPAAQLTEMEKQVVAIRAKHPDMLLLFECGYRMRIFAEDAENASSALGIRVHQYKNFRQTSVPVHRTLHHCRKLVDAGYKVGIVKQIDTVAMRALSDRKPRNASASARRSLLQRSVVEVYTRATVPLPEPTHEREQQDDAETDTEYENPTRFILCLVEETIHHKTLFTRKVHELPDESRKHVDEVRVGIFAHDVHTGESLYEEFQDDATRKHLQDLLEWVEPIEFVLPMGRLSVYTEQVLQQYAKLDNIAGASDRTQQQQKKRIRYERVDDANFDWSQANARFAQFFDSAEREYKHFVSRPTLPVLSTCCFGGMWAYLHSFHLEKTLVSVKYSGIQTASTLPKQQFVLASDSLRDLDIFQNSTTGEIAGSLFSILNHTKTLSGARRLREWMSSPSMSFSEIDDRQTAIQHLVFTSCESATTSYHLVYEELVANVLPRSRPMLRCIQQVHTRKATPSQLVKGLDTLVAVERCIEHTVEICRTARLEHLQLGHNQAEPAFLLQLLQSYPRMHSQLSQCLSEICREAAALNNTEDAILQRLHTNAELVAQYRRLQDGLLALDGELSAVLATSRRVLRDPSLQFASFRYGSAKEIRHLIRVSRESLHLVPPDWLVVNSTKKVVRFHPKEVYQLHMRQEYLLQMKEQLVQFAWSDFVAHVDAQIYVTAIECVSKLASMDAICSLATLARTQPSFTRPEFVKPIRDCSGSQQQVLEIVEGRNPIIETNLDKASYITNSIAMTSDSASDGSLVVISGPNMGGKSSLLRMCALIIIMAQIGSYVPAERARLSTFDGIHTRMHRSNTFIQRRSFLSGATSPRQQEMSALSKISRIATRKSFVLIDEIGFGMTSKQAGAFAYGLMVYLVQNVGCHAIFATHMTEVIERLKSALKQTCQTKQFGYTLVEAGVVETRATRPEPGMMTFHYTIKDGIASDSFALNAARLAGIPEHILHRAEETARDSNGTSA